MEANDFDALPDEEKLKLIVPGSIWTNRETGVKSLVVGFDGQKVQFIENPTEEQELLAQLKAIIELDRKELIESPCPDAASN